MDEPYMAIAVAQEKELREMAKKMTADIKQQILTRAGERLQPKGINSAEHIPGLTDRLQGAITALQEGLVERDTEVLTPSFR
jgi:mannitol/fructose-specific phosphotransferase system IIA component